jgi:2-C-methyl-D-erythritol 4-phosphate cytidylyltransferase/2-C-methyl-D-erythritol 2,4-cyclodiphosphate synthase
MIEKNTTAVVLLSAGKGTRLNSSTPKQYLEINATKTVLEESLITFLNHPKVHYIQPVINQEHEHLFLQIIAKITNHPKLLPYVFGGSERSESVLLGLKALETTNPYKVLIHDSARPFVQEELIDNIIEAIQPKIGVVAGIPIADSVKRVNNKIVYQEVDRSNLYSIQTPQGFLFSEILECYTKFSGEKLTDDSSYFLKNEYEITLINGNLLNSKITYEEDLENLKRLKNNFSEPKFNEQKVNENKANTNNLINDHEEVFNMDNIKRDRSNKENNKFFATKNENIPRNQPIQQPKVINLVGLGVDIHPFSTVFGENEVLYLGGVEIDYFTGLKAHSDGDVVLHALVDAILGALGEGDIGEHFPDTSSQFKDADSRFFLNFTNSLLKKHNAYINNVDITILAEEPKISPYKAQMKESIANILKISTEAVNIKATTAEKLGFVGRKEGITVHCIASLTKILE